MAKSYIVDHLQQSEVDNEQVKFIVELCEEHGDLIRARFQSRHSNHKTHVATVQFDEQKQQPIIGWYCTCSSGGRELGMCSHIAALLWHLGVARAVLPTSTRLLSAFKLLTAIDDSMKFSDIEDDSDNDIDLSFNINTKVNNNNNNNDEDSEW